MALVLHRGLLDLEIGEGLRLDRQIVGKAVAFGLPPFVIRGPRPSYDRVVFDRYIKIGDDLKLQDDGEGALKQYKMASRIAGDIATRDPGSRLWQSNLWESYDKIGELLVAKQRTPEALEHYQTAMKFAENVAAKYPQITEWSALTESMNARLYQTIRLIL